ncbi:MAG TPA: DUF4384 domain-containing protein [Bryobacteraceae bacterium]|nr:DUF4384 domain-containing protein [Bryobacteraceae bacterium]
MISLCAAGAAVTAAQEAPRPQLTARELFYSAASDKPPATPATPATSKPPAVPIQPKATTKSATAKRTSTSNVTPTTPVTATDRTPAATPAQTEPAPLPGGAVVIKTAAQTAPAPAAGTALGLKYTILKKSGDDMVEVPAGTVFHAGDRIQFAVQTNGAGYLYIISQGSSGTWKPMFPSAEVEDGNNRVDGWHSYVMPPGSRMVFDEQTGIEKIFIVFSRQPETDLENMIYSLQGAKPKPASQPKELPKPKAMVQVASIDDAMVGRLRTTYARDLIIEQVNDKTASDKTDKKEDAVYVVNPTGSSDSRVVADLKLVHQ